MNRNALAIERVAMHADRLSALLAAGIAPASAWAHLARANMSSDLEADSANAGNGDSVAADARAIASAALAAAHGDSVGRALAGAVAVPDTAKRSPSSDFASAWGGLAAMWAVGERVGAPLGGSLAALAESFRSLGAAKRAVMSARAGPVMTSRVVLALPLVGVLFGYAIGFNPLAVLFGSIPGLALLVLGVVLTCGSAWWSRALIRRAAPAGALAGFLLELMAVALQGGGDLISARTSVIDAAGDLQVAAADRADEWKVIDSVLALAASAGVPAAGLLRAEAGQRRREVRTQNEAAAAVLGVTLLLPLGICVLPAFILVGVAPVALAILSSTVESL